MYGMRWNALSVAVFGAIICTQSAHAQWEHCPAYPSVQRVAQSTAIQRSRQSQRIPLTSRLRRAAVVPASRNFIDEPIFAKMAADNVDVAPLTTDQEFVRRIYLDLTGRIPTFEQAQAFLADSTSTKRDKLIETLLASPAFADQFTHYFLRRFQITTATFYLGIPERNNFYAFVRDFVKNDRPYDAFVRDLLTATGDPNTACCTAVLSRQFDGTSIVPQDMWDNWTDTSTTQFLGYPTGCVSCHNGRGHLEQINLSLAPILRKQFWQLSAFFSQTRFQIVDDDNGASRRLVYSFYDSNGYTGVVNPANPGSRPDRTGANEQPNYWLTGDTPQSSQWRAEFARLITTDPQFSRAAVNYIWAYFFGSGIVDPPNAWDFDRIDPDNPPPPEWPLQNSNPDLLNDLAASFVTNQYSLRALIRNIVQSNTYQLSSRYPTGKWQAGFESYFARHESRRLTAEQLFDSLATATGTVPYLQVNGMPGLVQYANQLPHPNSALDANTNSLLTSLGQGDWFNRPPTEDLNLYGILDFFNSSPVAARVRSWSDSGSPETRLALWVDAGLNDTAIINNVFLATLTRPPTAAEVAAIIKQKQTDRLMWLTALQWALAQKSDFVFNY